MPDFQMNAPIKLVAWQTSADHDEGVSCNTAVTLSDGGTDLKLTSVGNDALNAVQRFVLLAAEGGFRICPAGSTLCVGAGDWFTNPDGSKTNVRRLVLKPIDPNDQTQVFSAEQAQGYSQIDAFKFACTLEDGARYELTPNDTPTKDQVLLTLGKGPSPASYNLFAVQGASPWLHVLVANSLPNGTGARFRVRWSSGQTPSVYVDTTDEAVIELDGVTPPPGTSCWVVATTSNNPSKEYQSSDNFIVATPRNEPFCRYEFARWGSGSPGFHYAFYG